MKGRKPIPTNLKVIHGTARPHRVNDQEPKPAKIKRPIAPKSLSDAARKHWKKVCKDLADSGVLTLMDQDALAIYCELYGQWLEAGDMIKKKGVVIADPRYLAKKTAVTVPVLSPYFKASLKLAEQMKALLCEFGMTPSSRSRIQAIRETPEDDSFEAWQKQQKERQRIAREGV